MLPDILDDLDAAVGDPLVSLVHLPDSFYDTDVLAGIRDAARARLVGPDAAVTCALARVSALTDPSIRLPAIVGTEGSLNVIVALVGPPGVGKSTCLRVVRELLPADGRRDVRDDVPLGSGEGLVDAYFEMVEDPNYTGKGTKLVKQQTIRSVLAVLDEGAALDGLGGRKGSTLMPTLRSAWTGDTLGQANASIETRRRLAAASYRLAAVIGFQPATAITVLDDTATGTAARFVWVHATDPQAPDQPPAWPGPLDWKPLEVCTYGADVFPQTMRCEQTIIDEIQDRRLARLRGETVVDEIDAHRDLARLKIAGLLAILHNRINITTDDWHRGGVFMRTSDIVRATVLDHATADRRRREAAATARHVAREAAVDDDKVTKAIERMAKSIGRHVHKHGSATRRDANRCCASRDRQLASVDDAIDRAAEKGWITVLDEQLQPGEARPL